MEGINHVVAACHNCHAVYGLDAIEVNHDWQFNYCSEECWLHSSEFGDKLGDLETFLGSLLPDQRRLLDNLLLDDVLQSNDFYGYISSRIREHKEA